MIDLATGELASLYGQASVACGNRREAVCPACSAVYKRDVRQLLRAGLADGKGIPETITAHPCVFATPHRPLVRAGPRPASITLAATSASRSPRCASSSTP